MCGWFFFCVAKKLNYLFIHQNFPSQFRALAPALASSGHTVRALVNKRVDKHSFHGVEVTPYSVARSSTAGIHPWLIDFETKIIRAEACLQACLQLRKDGFTPNTIIAHPGWGETLFLKRVWPDANLLIYCEFYYAARGLDLDFDPEFKAASDEDFCRIEIKNIHNQLNFSIADGGLSPTSWQKSTFPEPFRSKIEVIHDGIDTDNVRPDSLVSMEIVTRHGTKVQLDRSTPIVTFVNRSFEPLRGFHTFMRSVPTLLKENPDLRLLLIGGNEISYGTAPTEGTWRDKLCAEINPRMSEGYWERLHFLGNVGYSHFLNVLQLSTVHVYLTYPFVLSWSLLESMAAECAVIGSDTPPVREVIVHNHNGVLVDFFDHERLASEVLCLLDDQDRRIRLGRAARQTVVEGYDLRRVCLPRQLDWLARYDKEV
jgi:glycosyltransferase involved in cell wall biosynthesis